VDGPKKGRILLDGAPYADDAEFQRTVPAQVEGAGGEDLCYYVRTSYRNATSLLSATFTARTH